MPRTIFFADGFTAASAPTGSSSGVEAYTLSNGASAALLTTLDYLDGKTVFVDYELLRSTSLESFLQSGSLIFAHNGSWTLTLGNFMGDDLIVDTIVNTEHVKLMINSATGAITCDSGNMAGTSYIGTLKLNIVRVQ